MKYIAIVLLLANLGYFAWNYQQPLSAPVPQTPRPLLNTGLTLISEYDQQSAALAQEAARQCSVVTGFVSVDEANGFIENARALNLQAFLNIGESQSEPQYRVYLPPTPSREIATLTLDDLSERLLTAELEIETYLITRGELENAVALGVYLTRREAAVVQSQVYELGYTPFIDEIAEPDGLVQVWLRPTESERVNEAEWLDLSAQNGDLTRQENLCQTIAQASQFQ